MEHEKISKKFSVPQKLLCNFLGQKKFMFTSESVIEPPLSKINILSFFVGNYNSAKEVF